jgi:hypothetical protein
MNVTMDLTDHVLEFSRTYFAALDPEGNGDDRHVASVRVGESTPPSCRRTRRLRCDLTVHSSIQIKSRENSFAR